MVQAYYMAFFEIEKPVEIIKTLAFRANYDRTKLLILCRDSYNSKRGDYYS